MAKKDINRKCQHCDEKGHKTINMETDKFVVVKSGKVNKFWHFDCYVKHLQKKKKMEYEDALEMATISYENQSTEFLSKSLFYQWLYEYHEASSFSSFVFKRIDEVISGCYKNLKEPISYEDLLTMYKKQADRLNAMAIKKSRTGTGFDDSSSRVLYDMAVLVGKYDSFKKWKQKQMLLAMEAEKSKEKLKEEVLDGKNIKVFKRKKIKDVDDIDVDELF